MSKLTVGDSDLLPEDDLPADDGIDADEPSTRDRSTIAFPYVDLEDVIPVAKAIHERAGDALTLPQLADALGHDSPRSGAFRMKVSGARTFGLVRPDRKGVNITDLGRRIIDPSTEKESMVEAFLNVPLYRKVFEKYNGYALPPGTGLESVFGNLGVAEKQKSRARQVFMRAAQQAGFLNAAKTRLIEPTQRPRATPSPIQDAPPSSSVETKPQTTYSAPLSKKPALLEALYQEIPDEGAPWDFDSREKWLATAKTILDFLYRE